MDDTMQVPSSPSTVSELDSDVEQDREPLILPTTDTLLSTSPSQRPSSVRSAPPITSPIGGGVDLPLSPLGAVARQVTQVDSLNGASDGGTDHSSVKPLTIANKPKKTKTFRFARKRKDTDDLGDAEDDGGGGEDGAETTTLESLTRVPTGSGSLKEVMGSRFGLSRRKKSSKITTTTDEDEDEDDDDDDDDEEEEEGTKGVEGEGKKKMRKGGTTDAQAVAKKYRKKSQEGSKNAKKGGGGGEGKKGKTAHKATECPCGKSGDHYDVRLRWLSSSVSI